MSQFRCPASVARYTSGILPVGGQQLSSVKIEHSGRDVGLGGALDSQKREETEMDGPPRRLLVAPAALSAIGVAAVLAAPLLSERLRLANDGPAALWFHDAAGVWMWLALAWLAARCCDVLLRRMTQVSRRGAPYPRLLTDLLRAALFATAGITILLLVFGESATGLVTVSSVLIAVVGFALRSVISDIFSGIALGVDHPYAIGDWIETVQGGAGKVSEITWRTTRLVDRNGFAIVVPNGMVAGQRLINYGGDKASYRTSLRVPLDPTIPVSRAKRYLLAGALDASRRFVGLSPDVLLTEYADGAAVYAVRFHVPDLGHETACRDGVACGILNALHCAGHTIQRGGSGWHCPGWTCAARSSPREAILDRVDLFQAFDTAERAELAGKMRMHDVAAGQAFLRQGDSGDCLYLLAEGILDVEIERAGRPSVQDRIAPGEVFGEISLLTGQTRSATVTAALDSLVYEIGRSDLDPILCRRPQIIEQLAAVMAERLARNDNGESLPEPAPQPTREDLLVRLRLLFRL